MLLTCPKSSATYGPELYSLIDGTHQTVTPIPEALYDPEPGFCEQAECAAPERVGAYWIQWYASCYHCGVPIAYFQNIQTGEVRDDPTNATTYADLNSPTLAHKKKRCPGVRLIHRHDRLLANDGQFVLVGDHKRLYLERCGTRMRRLLAHGSRVSNDLAFSAGAIVWQAVASKLNGVFLPSLQRFTIPLPAAIVKPPGATKKSGAWLLLTPDTLYVQGGWDTGGQCGRQTCTIWQTASPTALPLNMRQPSITRSGGTLTCKHGSWRDADRFSYAWLVNDIAHKRASDRLAIGKARRLRRVSCSVTASNADGTTTATSARCTCADHQRSHPRASLRSLSHGSSSSADARPPLTWASDVQPNRSREASSPSGADCCSVGAIQQTWRSR